MRKYEQGRALDGSCAAPASAVDERSALDERSAVDERGATDEPGAAVRRAAGAPEHRGSMGELLHRGQAFALLEECGVRLRAGRPVVVVIEGDRGSGKSALLGAVAAGCEAGVVLGARCHGAERGFRFGVVSQLLDRLPADDLAPVAPTMAAGAAESREYDLLDRSYRVVRAVAARGPVVLAIDDVHLADPLSARWCSYVARRLDDLPVGVLVTVRSGGLPAGSGDPAAAELIADLGALAHSRLVRTGPLCAECAGKLIARKLGRPVDPDFARQCHALARGNPRVLSVVAARLPAGAGAGDGADGAALEVAARALAGTALGWLRQDDPVKAGVAEQFAVCGGGTLEIAAMLADQGEDVARAARVTLRQIGLLDSRAPDRFAHPTMGDAITDLLRPQARAAMHAHAATMLSQIGEPAMLAAEHAMSAGPIGEPWARQVLRQAAQQAAAAGDWPRGARYLSRALLEPGPPRQTLAITAELGAFEFHLDVGACLRRAGAAADLAADDPDSAADLAVLADAALAAEDGDAAAVFCRAAAALAAAKIPARSALLRLAAPALLSGRTLLPEQAAGVRQAMRGLADGPRDMAARQLLSALALSMAARGRNQSRCKALALRSAAGGPVQLTDPLPSTTACAALALAWAGELDTASDACAQAVEAAHRMASRTGEALALFVRSEIACQRGDLTAALNDADQALRLFQATGATGLQAAAAAALTRVLLMRGEPAAIPAQATSPALEASGHPFILGIQQEARGMTAAAQANRALALRLYLESGRHLMAARLVNPACSAWRSRAVTVLAGFGRVWEARTLADSEIRLARAWGAPGPLGRALVAAAAAQDGPARRELLSEAVTVLEGSGYRLHLARALIRLGSEMRAAGPSRTARDVLERGLELARDCGAPTLAATANRTMHAAGARPRGHPAPATLTAAERRVAELVVTGMSNQAVATTLVLSKRTVDTHLGRIYRKLGITSRTRLSEALSGPGVHAQEAV
jgi:DNA-binding CsgD family transcriptional regulator/tetratricopeptide (TPR) repeat protein